MRSGPAELPSIQNARRGRGQPPRRSRTAQSYSVGLVYGGNFTRIVRDNSTYYVIGYDSPSEADGRAHRITVRLRNRPDLSVRTGRKGFTGNHSRCQGSIGQVARGPVGAGPRGAGRAGDGFGP